MPEIAEAQALLAALAESEEVKAAEAQRQRRLHLQTAYGQAMMWTKGFSAEETKAAFSRATELAAKTDNFVDRFAMAHGQWTFALVRGELQSAHQLASAFLKEAETAGRVVEAGVARRALALACYQAADFQQARTHCERALEACDAESERKAQERFQDAIGPVVMSILAVTTWQVGEIDRARELIEQSIRRASELGHPPSMASPLSWKTRLEILRGDAAAALISAETLEELSREHGMPFWRTMAELIVGWARGRLHDAAVGVEDLRRGLADRIEQGTLNDAWFFKGLLAELEAESLGAEHALARADEAIVLARQVENRCNLPFVHLLRGKFLLGRDPSDPAPAEEAFQTALAIAQEQGARSWGLRAALSLAKLYQSNARPVDAHAILAPALEGFAPTPEMPEIAEAQAVLAALAETDEVKASEMQHQRLMQLQVAYGNALFQARGYGAPETTKAFARVRDTAAGGRDASERLAADYGLWVGSMTRGELSTMRTHAAAFLRDVQARPNTPEAGVAYRAVGMTHWFAGEYAKARNYLDRAFALFHPVRDDDLAFRFAHDTGVAAMLHLAFTLWPLGEVKRAISLVVGAQTRIAGLSYKSAYAMGKMHTAMFGLLRGVLAQTVSSAAELGCVARDHDLNFWRAYGVCLEGWVKSMSSEPPAGLEEMRSGLELLREQNTLLFVPLLKLVLGEAEARARDHDSAIATLEDALATSRRSGHRAFDAELHRVRGEILLKSDPDNPAPAEDAYQTAVAIARQQGTRAFELRAALSLAKLYQSTARPVEAHAIVAPALEGFAPTPEMPEIAEAQAVLAALAETEEVKTVEAQRQRRLHLQTAYGQAMMMTKGYAAEETKAAFARAAELAGKTHDFSERFTLVQGQFAAATTAGELRSARELALTLLREAEEAGRVTEVGIANWWLGLIVYWRGDLAGARTHYERALDARDPTPDPKVQERFSDFSTWSIWASAQFARTAWALGELERARKLIDLATRRAAESDVPTITNAHFWNSYLEVWRDDPAATLKAAQALELVAQEHGIAQYLNEAELHSGWARGRMNDPIAGAAQMQRVLAAFVEQGVRVNLGFYTGLLAQLEAETLGAESALARIDEAFRLSNAVGHGCSLPFLHRLRGEILLKRDPSDPALAEEAFHASIGIAKAQSARSPLLLASFALANLLQSIGRSVEAQAVLEPAVEGFAPTPELPEIAEAQALLAALAKNDEVRAAITQRERRFRLQTAYGQAMMWSKGYAAEETKVAFARAAELAGRIGEFSERLMALHGQWAVALVGGELRSARDLAFELLHETEDAGRAWEVGIANRMLGLTAYLQGDFVAAKTFCERALEAPDTKPDLNFGERFNADSLVSLAYLAPTTWALGQVQRARELIDAATQPAVEIDIPAMADALHWKVDLEILRNDPFAALSAAEALKVVVRESTMAQWLNLAELTTGWARGRIDDPVGGAAQVRRALAHFLDQGVRSDVGFLSGLLAELEAKTLGGVSGLARIDEAVRLTLQFDNRFALSFLHRISRRNPSGERPNKSRSRSRGVRDRDYHCEGSGRAEFRVARVACPRKATSIDRSPRRSPRRPRPGARRLLTNAGNAADRRGAGALWSAHGDRRGQNRRNATPAEGPSANRLWQSRGVVEGLCCRGDQCRFLARKRTRQRDWRLLRAFRGSARTVDLGADSGRTSDGARACLGVPAGSGTRGAHRGSRRRKPQSGLNMLLFRRIRRGSNVLSPGTRHLRP
jgi:tetratricopeptide (TPR) repeat protein